MIVAEIEAASRILIVVVSVSAMIRIVVFALEDGMTMPSFIFLLSARWVWELFSGVGIEDFLMILMTLTESSMSKTVSMRIRDDRLKEDLGSSRGCSVDFWTLFRLRIEEISMEIKNPTTGKKTS